MQKNMKWAALAMAVAVAFSAGCKSSGSKDSSSLPATAPDSGISTAGAGGNGGYDPNALNSAALSQHSVYFDYDRAELKPEGQAVVAAWGKYLSTHPTARVRLEGNTDERGTREYNIALGERRANSVSSALQAQGASASQIVVVSYGEERPVAMGHDEASYAQNRRADIVQQ